MAIVILGASFIAQSSAVQVDVKSLADVEIETNLDLELNQQLENTLQN